MRIILIILFSLLFTIPVGAQQWVNTQNKTGTTVFLDTDSIVKTNRGTFFNIMYYSKEANEQVIGLMHMVGNQAGVLRTVKLSQYSKNKINYERVKLDNVKLKTYNTSSPIYNACNIVKEKTQNQKSKEYKYKSPIITVARSSDKTSKAESFSNPPNWDPYMKDLEQRIKRNWQPPKGNESKRVVVTFVIGRDGRLLSYKVTQSSGVVLADKAAMTAIETTAPFRPLPPEFKGNSVPIEFTFDYNVLNQNK